MCVCSVTGTWFRLPYPDRVFSPSVMASVGQVPYLSLDLGLLYTFLTGNGNAKPLVFHTYTHRPYAFMLYTLYVVASSIYIIYTLYTLFSFLKIVLYSEYLYSTEYGRAGPRVPNIMRSRKRVRDSNCLKVDYCRLSTYCRR